MISVHRKLSDIHIHVYRQIKKQTSDVSLIWNMMYEDDKIIKCRMVDCIHFEVQDNIDET